MTHFLISIDNTHLKVEAIYNGFKRLYQYIIYQNGIKLFIIEPIGELAKAKAKLWQVADKNESRPIDYTRVLKIGAAIEQHECSQGL